MTRTIESIWCDDIRSETGGKISLMGVYQSELVTPVEITIPKICCYVMIKSPVDEKISSVVIRLMKNDREELVRVNLNEVPEIPNNLPDAKFYHIAAAMIIAPFQIDKSTKCLRAVADIDGQEVSGGGLNIRINPSAQEDTGQV